MEIFEFFSRWFLVVLVGLSFGMPCQIAAQTIYGSGPTGGSGSNLLFTINGSSGATTQICTSTPLQFGTTAIAQANSRNGILYYIEFTTSTTVFPRLNTFDPATCTNGTAISIALSPATRNAINKATICPDGRLYAMSAQSNFELYEVNPATGTIRTINLTSAAIASVGGGDIACDGNGDIWMALNAVSTTDYALVRLNASSGFATLPSGSTVGLNFIGNFGLAWIPPLPVPAGLALYAAGSFGCAPSPAVCLLMSTTPGQGVYAIDTNSAAITFLGTTSGHLLTDLTSNLPIDVSVVKTATPTSVKTGETVTYFINVSNVGIGTASPVNVLDTFSSGVYSSINWVCGVVNGGLSTDVTTACAGPSGSGNISHTVSLSINGAVRYTVTAVLNSSTTSTLTNVASARTSSNFTDSVPSNNTSTITVPVNSLLRANLSVTKSNGTTTLVAGSTTNYTVTFSNFGPDAADGAIVQDSPSNGLSNCSVVTCIPTGTASCPATVNNIFSPSSTTLPSFPAMTSVTFVIRCQVTATGF